MRRSRKYVPDRRSSPRHTRLPRQLRLVQLLELSEEPPLSGQDVLNDTRCARRSTSRLVILRCGCKFVQDGIDRRQVAILEVTVRFDLMRTGIALLLIEDDSRHSLHPAKKGVLGVDAGGKKCLERL